MERRRNYRLRVALDDADPHADAILAWFRWTLMPAALKCPVPFSVEFVAPEDVRPPGEDQHRDQ